MNRRTASTDLTKFIAALFIMTHHLYNASLPQTLTDNWIYVEFFLLITGYFTTKHFDVKNVSQNNPIKEGILYTFKKFIPIFPYTICFTVLSYLTNGIIHLIYGDWNTKSFVYSFLEKFPLDLLLITVPKARPLMESLWYLSALLIVMPLFSSFVQLRNRYSIMLISITYSLYHYSQVGVISTAGDLRSVFRVMAGLCLGAFIYEFTYVFEDYFQKMNKNLLIILEISSFVFVIISCINNWGTYDFNLLCFIVYLTITLPNFSHTPKIHCKAIAYLGKLSLPIYITHWYIGMLVSFLGNQFFWNNLTKSILYYSGTIIVSMLAMHLLDHWVWFQAIKNTPLKLKD